MTLDTAKSLYSERGYAFFETGPYNLNLFAIRQEMGLTNKFDDLFCAMYKNNAGEWQIHTWPCTTKPGKFYELNPMNAKGVGILAPGQYRRAYEIGLHKGKPALVQVGPVIAYRDNNRDGQLQYDPKSMEEGFFAANIHSAGVASVQVDKWSAMCTVFARKADHDALMLLARTAASIWGNRFTYTLFQGE